MLTTRIDNPRTLQAARAFALVEVLIAIFILAIGMISVATIFPVAIHQSRQATDDIVGQMVGEQALALLRTKGVTTVIDNDGLMTANGNLITPGGVKEGFIHPLGYLVFNIPGKGEDHGIELAPGGTIVPNARFGIPAATLEEQEYRRLRAYEMVWPVVSGFPDPSKPLSERPLDFPEAERHPQYAWKVVLFKPEVNSPITATILVYRVSNWSAFWNFEWQNVFPDLSRTLLGKLIPGIADGSRSVTPGDIFIKSEATLRPPAPVDEIGSAWRIIRTRPDRRRVPEYIGGGNARDFASLLPDGAIYHPRALVGNVQFLHLPATDIGRFRPVAVVTGAIDR